VDFIPRARSRNFLHRKYFDHILLEGLGAWLRGAGYIKKLDIGGM